MFLSPRLGPRTAPMRKPGVAFAPRARWVGNMPPDADGVRLLLSDPAFFPNALTPGDALALLRANLGHPRHRFWAHELSFIQAL
jgi:hypothetical protein